jgi:hypothetical protein
MECIETAQKKFEKAIGHQVDTNDFFKAFSTELKLLLDKQITQQHCLFSTNTTFDLMHKRFILWYTDNDWKDPTALKLYDLITDYCYAKQFIVLLRYKHDQKSAKCSECIVTKECPKSEVTNKGDTK